jgi:predicted transcriptional regulator
MLALRLNEDTERRLDRMAKITGRSKHFFAMQGIEKNLQALEKQYLNAQEQAEMQAWVDFDRIDMALAGEFDPDLLNEAEHGHYFDVKGEEFTQSMLNPSPASQAVWANISASKINSSNQLVWPHSDGTEKPFPPTESPTK